eukprot:IDg10789t1
MRGSRIYMALALLEVERGIGRSNAFNYVSMALNYAVDGYPLTLLVDFFSLDYFHTVFKVSLAFTLGFSLPLTLDSSSSNVGSGYPYQMTLYKKCPSGESGC